MHITGQRERGFLRHHGSIQNVGTSRTVFLVRTERWAIRALVWHPPVHEPETALCLLLHKSPQAPKSLFTHPIVFNLVPVTDF